jgi:hypothetical protein
MIAQAGDTHKPIGKLPAKKPPPWLLCANWRVHVQTVCQDTHTSKKIIRQTARFYVIYIRASLFFFIWFLSFKSPAEIVFFRFPKKLIESFFGRGDDDDILTLFGVIGLISLFLFLIFISFAKRRCASIQKR